MKMLINRSLLWTLVLALTFLRVTPNTIEIPNNINDDDGCSLMACYQKLQPGKKTIETHVGRVIKCEHIRDCRRSCDYEKDFYCEGFNYRRSAEGSKGTCELTTTPYPRMNLHRDFVADSRCDYYERNRNCLPETWRDSPQSTWWNDRPFHPDFRTRSPGYESNRQGGWPLLNRPDKYEPPGHISGRPPYYRENRPSNPNNIQPPPFFPSTGTDDRFRYDYEHDYRVKFPDTRVYGANFGRPYDNWRFSNRRADDDDYHRNGDERKISSSNWNPNDGVYGNSYGYRHNGIDEVGRLPSVPEDRTDNGYLLSRENENFYGKFYNYGGAFGYGDNYIPAVMDPLYGDRDQLGNSKCSIRVAAGSRLGNGLVRKTYLTRDLNQCEGFCINERSFLCASFTYRYNVLATDPTDNCLLSDTRYQDLNLYTDLEPNRDYDIYSVIDDSKACYLKKLADRNPSEECFSRVRSGFSMPTDITKKSMFVDGLGECQVACTMTRAFLCRSFAFKYSTEHRPYEEPRVSGNCFLSDWPSREINPANMPDMDGAELYERGSYAQGCEPYPFPLLEGPPAPNGKKIPIHAEEHCYSGYHRPCRLMPHAVLSSSRVDAESECRRKCSTMRQLEPVPCMSFSYKTASDEPEANCFLSDVSMRDLRPSVDYMYDDGNVLYAWKDLDPHCSHVGNSLNSMNSVNDGGYPITFRALPHDGARMPYPSISNYPSNPSGGGSFDEGIPSPPVYGPPFHAENENKPANDDDIQKGPPYVVGGFERGFGIFYPKELSVFRRFTVNGRPCKNSTICQRNEVAGFWSCEVEGADFGSWDYCCEPNHRCGFSRGYHYPWCYVGSSEDQWRPCTETYHPYDSPSEKPEYRKSSGNSPRHWPIMYLHQKPPPNCTDDISIDNSNNRGRRFDHFSNGKPKDR